MLVLCAGAAFILALAFAVYSFVVCGKKMRDGKVKLAWIDYIPTDIHLIASAAAIGGLITAIVAIFAEGMENQADPLVQKYMYYGVLALVALIWALFIEFMTSFIRACKSEKRLYKNTLIYFFIKYVIVKPIAFFIRKFKEFVSYNPDNFKMPIKRGAVLYFIVNAVLFVIAVIGAAADFAPLSALMALLLVAFNIASAVYVIRYVIALDKIIYAAKTKTAPMVDYNKLPQSLKILVNSLQYTRQELNEAVNKAVRDEHMRTELITNVSHDLKTPLTSIINYVDLLKTCDIQDETAKEYIDILDEKGSRLKRLIEDLIEASKITSGVITLNPVNLSLSELGAQAVYERQSEFAENGLELVFKGDRGNVTAFADGNKTFRVIENLLSNARKYSAKGSRVYCDVYETQNYSIFEIKNISAAPLDITPQELKERFVRGDKSRNNEGNGLGLSIADNLCKAQNGHLNITIDGDLFKAQVMLPKAKQLN
ncbi:MAG: HAMP domain-containing histidine kinase [Eubacterium sp.]|nr:HAMP domain-containing histidine kinase [Eubacterium sp.]